MINSIILMLLILCLFTATAQAATFNLPDSGQTKCYQVVSPYAEIPCAGTGQDGAYSINPMSFADNGNGTITDNNTGLVWQKCSVGQNNDAACSGTASTYNWYQASGTYDAGYNSSTQNVCGSLALAGGGWRLPSKKELTDIVDYSIPFPGPTIQQSRFPNTIASIYWSSTTYAGYPGGAWVVGFYYGEFAYGGSKGYSYYVRCVRGGQSGSFGSLSISFSSIPAQNVNTSFTTTVSAYDNNGAGQTGWVQLSLASGNRLSPTWVYLSNGTWSGSLTLYSPEADARIIGTGLGLSGSSNNFAVTDSANSIASGTFTGKVTSNYDGIPLKEVNVVIRGTSTGVYETVMTDSKGRYHKFGLPSGEYVLYVSNGTERGGQKTSYVNSGETRTIERDQKC